MKLNILVSTIDKGISAVEGVLLSKREDVSYRISHQYTRPEFFGIPEGLVREDILVSQIQGRGVTKSRNNAIRISDGDIGLFADDDVRYQNEWLDMVKKTFRENPQMDIAIFKIKTLPGEPEYRDFPQEEMAFSKAPSVGTIQLAFRIRQIKEKGIHFDERFGAGQKLLIGSDEQIFLHDCIRSGLKVMYFPEYVVQHAFQSTVKGIQKYDSKLNRVTGGLDARMNGWVALPKALLGTIKYTSDILRNRKNPVVYFMHRFYAALYVLLTSPVQSEKTEKNQIIY